MFGLTMNQWPDHGAIEVFEPSGLRLCIIPVGSLKSSGNLNWCFVLHCIRQCVHDPEYIGELRTVYGKTVNQLDDLFSGRYLFGKPKDGRLVSLPLQYGPYIAPLTGAIRPSYLTSILTTLAKERDSRCVISGEEGECICDIVPYAFTGLRHTLAGAHEDVTGITNVLLLSHTMCDAFSNYDVAIYPSVRDGLTTGRDLCHSRVWAMASSVYHGHSWPNF